VSGEATPAVVQDWRLAEQAPWLGAARTQWLRAIRTGRLPHALLLQGLPATGTFALADWIARATFCERAESAPCGACDACTLHAAGNHPDLLRLGIREDRKQIVIDDVRELIATLGLKSFRGGRRVAIVAPADAMNVNGANALLKTLEEPGAGTLLILVVGRADRLPVTIASRCQRITVPLPAEPVALAWLKQQDPSGDWTGTLALAGGAPLAALELGRAGGAQVGREMAELPAMLDRGDADVVALAERWAKQQPAVRLRWIENWVTDRLRKAALSPAAGHSPTNPGLPPEVRTRHIQALYGLLDETRAAQAALGGSANVALLFERVLLALAGALAQLRRPTGSRLAEAGRPR
jgi:DNA polymerase-3 subunit delta'